MMPGPRLWLTIVYLLLAAGRFSAQDVTVYITETANIRECPRLSCAVVVSIPQFTEVVLLGDERGEAVSDSDQWVLVRVADSEAQGYVHSSLTSFEEPNAWKALPVIPEVGEAMREVYTRGQEMGNNPRAFSVVGDCQNVDAYFLADFESPLQYNLGKYEYLQETIDYFAGSFGRDRAAVRGGYNVASVLSPMWADPEQCEKGESPLACEYRLQRPSFVLISMETWWDGQPAETYEEYLRQVVEFWIERGVVPILATKADNLEGDHRINAAIARVAQDYSVPLWNFWRAVQDLPGHGLTEDRFHLTYGRPFFNDSSASATGWAIRNLTALQALDAVWKTVTTED